MKPAVSCPQCSEPMSEDNREWADMGRDEDGQNKKGYICKTCWDNRSAVAFGGALKGKKRSW